jgi:hypothetical protein
VLGQEKISLNHNRGWPIKIMYLYFYNKNNVLILITKTKSFYNLELHIHRVEHKATQPVPHDITQPEMDIFILSVTLNNIEQVRKQKL